MNETIHIRVTSETKRKIEVIATQRGRTVSDFAREVLVHEISNKDVLDVLEQQNYILSWVLKFAISGSISLEEFIKVGDKGMPSLDMSKALKEKVALRMSKMFQQITTDSIE